MMTLWPRPRALAVLAVAALTILQGTAALRSEALPTMASDDEGSGLVYPRFAAPQPLYLERAEVKARDPDAKREELWTLLAADAFFAGPCLKFVSIHIGDVPGYDAHAVPLNASTAATLRVSIPSVGVEAMPLTAFYSTPSGSGEAPQLGELCDARIEDVLSEADVTLTLPSVGASPPGSRVNRVLPDVDPSEELPALARGSGGKRFRVGLCSMFTLDGALGGAWRAYWAAMGVTQFFLYYNGQFSSLEEGETKQMRELAAAPNVTLIEWPFPYFLRFNPAVPAPAENFTVAAGRAVTATHCAHAYGASVDLLLVADAKDWLVLPRHPDLHALLGELEGEHAARGEGEGAPSAAAGTAFGFHSLGLPGYWGAVRPSPSRVAGLEMGVGREMAERIRGDLVSLRFLRGAPVLRHAAPNATIGRYGVARGAPAGVLCAHSPCRAGPGASPPMVELNVSASDAYIVRVVNLGAPIGWNASQIAEVVANATELDVSFRRHVEDAAAVEAGLQRPSEAARGTGAALAAAAVVRSGGGGGDDALPPPVAKLHAELARRQLLPPSPDSSSAASLANCSTEGRRFLAFVYGPEQAASGFAAVFQAYAAALALALASNRTLVELLPHPVKRTSSAAGASALDSFPSRAAMFEAVRTTDPWHRAPVLACHGAKMGCFFEARSGCAIAGVSSGALPGLNLTAELLLAGTPLPRVPGGVGGNGSGKQGRKGRIIAEAPLVRVEPMDASRPEARSATRGDFAPRWFREEAAAWACGGCGAVAAAASARAPNSSSSSTGAAAAADAAGAVAAALAGLAAEDHCATYCSAGPEAAWRRLWFPAIESWLFAPRPEIRATAAEAVARLTAPPLEADAVPGASLATALAGGGLTAAGAAGAGGLPSMTRTRGEHTFNAPHSASRAARGLGAGAGAAAVSAVGEISAEAVAGGEGRALAVDYSGLRPHAAVGLHFRSGDATEMLWRSHAPLASYVAEAKALVLALGVRANRAAGQAVAELIANGPRLLPPAVGDALGAWAASPLAPHLPQALRNVSVHASLLLVTDSAAARASLRELVWDYTACIDSPLLGGPHNRSIVVAAPPQPTAGGPPAAETPVADRKGKKGKKTSTPSPTPTGEPEPWVPAVNDTIHPAYALADPIMARLDGAALRMLEEQAAEQAPLMALLRGRTLGQLASVTFDRVGTTSARLLTASTNKPPANASADAASPSPAPTVKDGEEEEGGAASGSASSSATPTPSRTPLPTPHDITAHTETWITGKLALIDALLGIPTHSDAPALLELVSAAAKPYTTTSSLADAVVVPLGAPPVVANGSSYNSTSGDGDREAAEKTAQVSAEFLASLTSGVVGDIWALSHANYIVGSCLSQISRLAHELSYAAGRARSHPVALDATLCRALPMPAPYALLADWRDTFDTWLGDGM